MEKRMDTKILEEIPKTVSQSIPYRGVYINGVIEVCENMFSKSYKIPGANFKTTNQYSQESLSDQYKEFMNSFDNTVSVETTMYNRTVDVESFKKSVLIDYKEDGLDNFREEYNKMLMDKISASKNNLQTEKYLTLTIYAPNIFAANETFSQMDALVMDSMATMAKKEAEPMTLVDRLSVLNSIYNMNDEENLYEKRIINGKEIESFSLENCVKQGVTTKEIIAPSSMKFYSDHGEIEDKLVRVYYVYSYPTWLKATAFTDFSKMPCNMIASTHTVAMDQNDAINLFKKQDVNISSDILVAQKKASKSGYSSNLISRSLLDEKNESDELIENITKDNNKTFVTTYVFAIFGDTKEELDTYERQLKTIANKNLMKVKLLRNMQEDGFTTCLPIGYRKVKIDRLMTSDSIASLIPFDVLNINQKGGKYYGLNAFSQNMILYNRASGMNPNAVILGAPGSGKSFSGKREIIDILLRTGDEVYVIDPDREYSVLANRFNGTVYKIAPGLNIHINPFDLNINNIDDENGDPVKTKCEFISTIIDIMIGGKYGLSPIEESIIDRCTMKVYDPYLKFLRVAGKTQDFEHAPTLVDFYNCLCAQPQIEAQNLALSLERFVKGALDLFAYKTNVDINNRFTVYDTKNIGPGLSELGSHICLDNMFNKMIQNFENGKRTWIYIDEFYSLMNKPSSATYTAQIWKRDRKWDGFATALTQNVEDVLKNAEARTVLNNSAFVTLLGQSPLNKRDLSELYGLSSTEEKYIASGKSGMGLICINNGDIIVPMNDDFPKDTELYRIMTSKPDERMMV